MIILSGIFAERLYHYELKRLNHLIGRKELSYLFKIQTSLSFQTYIFYFIKFKLMMLPWYNS